MVTTVVEVGELAADAVEAVGEVLLDDQHLGARVVELVAQVLALVGGVDRHRDGAGPDDAPPREGALDRVLDQRGHPVAGLHAGGDQRVGDPAGGVVHVGRGDLLAVDVEVLAGGVALEAAS